MSMNYKNKKRLQIINYIFNNLNSTDGLSKEFIGKLIYMSNKLFLIKYGCTITGDKFLAFERGTNCSEVLGIMDLNSQYVDDNDAIKEFKKLFDRSKREHSKKTHTIFLKDNSNTNYDLISENERKVIDVILNRFGKMRDSEISDYTHKFLEWKEYKECLNSNLKKVCDIDMNKVFDDNTFWEDEEISKYLDTNKREIAKLIYNGDF